MVINVFSLSSNNKSKRPKELQKALGKGRYRINDLIFLIYLPAQLKEDEEGVDDNDEVEDISEIFVLYKTLQIKPQDDSTKVKRYQ